MVLPQEEEEAASVASQTGLKKAARKQYGRKVASAGKLPAIP